MMCLVTQMESQITTNVKYFIIILDFGDFLYTLYTSLDAREDVNA
jgi:hypothetical protein